MIDLTEFIIEKLSAIPGVTVRGSYDTTAPQYPLITVKQMDNYELPKYTTIDSVERVSAIPIQLDTYARNMIIEGEKFPASVAASIFRQFADDIMQDECSMRRTASPETIPHTTDNTVMRAISRYDCMVYLDQNIIFKK